MSPEQLRSGAGNVELWLILGYVAALLAGARIVEVLARFHFARALRYSTRGFEYIEAHDLYRCPQGEHLLLQKVDPEGRLAVYRARSSSCGRCPLKASCTPFDEGRVIFRSMAAWVETDVGMFHRGVSALMTIAAVMVCAAGLWRWSGRPELPWLLIALVVSLAILVSELHAIVRDRGRAARPTESQQPLGARLERRM